MQRMEGLQRSSSTFRRSGSSGLVWDERFLTEDAEAKAAGGADEPQPGELRRSRSAGGVGTMLRRAGGSEDKKQQQKKKQQQGQKKEEHDQQVFRTKDVAPDVDPPSPRLHPLRHLRGLRLGCDEAGPSQRRSNGDPILSLS